VAASMACSSSYGSSVSSEINSSAGERTTDGPAGWEGSGCEGSDDDVSDHIRTLGAGPAGLSVPVG
jgi:hypothetical protein